MAAEERLDDKYLFETSDSDISAEDAALGYESLHKPRRASRVVPA